MFKGSIESAYVAESYNLQMSYQWFNLVLVDPAIFELPGYYWIE